MGMIKVLSEKVANKIAAGEVIERPASIVKELIENSLDAGATAVEISVKNGGKSLIRVADNGSGMNAEDAELAFLRHATSKITKEEDLDEIRSLGFRGEALPSIAAVSRVKLLTRPKGAVSGTEILVEGGQMVSVKPCAAREGTIFEARDLFFNTPARRKFLKADSTELGHIVDTVSNLALANPSVRFVLESADKKVWDLLPGQTFRQRAEAILGPEAAKYLLEIHGETEGMKISGVIGKPYLVRANRSGQVFFINQRWIRSIGLSYAVQDGFHGLVMHGQYPVSLLLIELDPARVDVNVHPTKQEVRISKESELKSLLRRSVAEALQKEGDLVQPLKTPVNPEFSGYKNPVQVSYLNLASAEIASDEIRRVAEPEPLITTLAEELPQPISIRGQLRITKVLGQIHHTFLVAETEEGMIIVDQHAAHEKVMFETLLKEFQTGQPKRQRLLMDEVLELHPRHRELFEHALPFLEKMGFEIESFGENSYVVRAYPAALENENPAVCIQRFLEEKEDGKLGAQLEYSQEEIAALIACKRKSVKAHDPLTTQAVRTLLERLALCENPFNCPHGRPTIFKYSFSDLEKFFKRK